MKACTCGATPRPTSQKDVDRFWAKVDIRKETECWEWQGFIGPRGYGQWTRVTGASAQCHRWAYIFTNGEVPAGMVVDHKCHNRKCVNPNHLRAVTPAENSQNRKGPTARNSSGHRGVTWHTKAKKWQARAMKDGRYHSAGLYAELADAAAAATALRVRLYGNKEAA